MIAPKVQQLLRLQELDQGIRRLDAEIKQLGTQIDEVKNSHGRRTQVLQRLETDRQKAAAARAKAELDLKSKEDQLKRFRKQSELVTTTKEFQAINHQLEAVAADVSRLEEQILESMETEERLAQELRDKTGASTRMDQSGSESETRLTGLRTEKQQLLRGLKEDRITSFNALDEDTRGTYQWLVGKHGTTAVATLEGDSCGACGGIVVPHLAIEIRGGTQARQCNHCQRFLYAKAP
jgi:uncharacterized protein